MSRTPSGPASAPPSNVPCVHQLFEQRCARTPSAAAIRCGGITETFAGLNRSANQVARALRSRGVRPGSAVAICCDRSIDMLWAMIGVMKAGAAYVPIEPSWSGPRIAAVLAESGSAVGVGNRVDLLGTRPPETRLDFSQDLAEIRREPPEDLDIDVPCDSVCSIIFTSGSTGRPKGVLVPMTSVLNQLSALNERHPLQVGDVSLVQRSYSVIGATWDYLGPLLAGVTSVLPTARIANDPMELWRLIVAEQVTVLWASPVLLRSLVEWGEKTEGPCETLRLATAGGDLMPPRFPARWRKVFPNARLFNSYGATECSHVAQHDATDVDPLTARVPVGQPLAAIRTYVVDDGMRELPCGESGTLCVGGPSLAYGYLRSAALTAARFLPDPLAPEPGSRMFWTGDRAVRRVEGTLELQGRLDRQVKVLGHRVELDDVETAIRDCAGVRAAAVVPREYGNSDITLTAYIVRDSGAGISPRDLRPTLLASLPAYMVPSRCVEVSSLPITNSGKVDRVALASVDAPVAIADAASLSSGTLEQRVADIAAAVLDLHTVGLDDNLLALGGDSLLAMRIVFQVYDELQVEISLAAFFDDPTVRCLTMLIDAARRQSTRDLPPVVPREAALLGREPSPNL